MATATEGILTSHNPANGAELGWVPETTPDEVRQAVAAARLAQADWAARPWKQRREVLTRWWKILARDAEALADLIRDEVGKPRVEAMAGDVIATLDALRWTIRNAPSVLAASVARPGHQRFLRMPKGRVVPRPVGVVGMIGTWNYPLFLNAAPIVQALAAGNAVVWKPSELASLVGLRIALGLDEAGLPEGLVSTVFGGPEVGKALVESDIDKGLFTGGVENGRRVLSALAARGIPGVAELSGFDPALVLPGAPMGPTAKAITWGAFVGAGQTCVSIKRVYVVGDPAPWAAALAERARALRVGDPAKDDVDIGPLVSRGAREKVEAMVRSAVAAGAEALAGGSAIEGAGWFFPPTVLATRDAAPEAALAGIFGPVITVRGVESVDAAVAAANASSFGLAASVWTRDRRGARAVAERLQAGTVTINDAVTPTMHVSAPFGGMKASGFGRTHGPAGLLEFTQPMTFFERGARGLRPQIFPYGKLPTLGALRFYRRMFHSPK